METEEHTIAICSSTSAESKYGSLVRYTCRSSSSSGLGRSTSATRRRVALAHLVAHRVLARLERAHEPLRLLLEHLAALVEPVARSALRQLLRAARELAAALDELVADLAS